MVNICGLKPTVCERDHLEATSDIPHPASEGVSPCNAASSTVKTTELAKGKVMPLQNESSLQNHGGVAGSEHDCGSDPRTFLKLSLLFGIR